MDRLREAIELLSKLLYENASLKVKAEVFRAAKFNNVEAVLFNHVSSSLVPNNVLKIGLPGVRFLTGQSGFLAICPVKNMMLNRTISCPVFGRP